MKHVIYAVVIVLLAAAVRFYGVNWDQNQHLHPDERFLTMVAAAAKVPTSLSDYLDPSKSTLNPYNLHFDFYVYGTLPVTLNKLLVWGSTYDSYNGITIFGRYMSAVADVGTLIVLMLIVRMLVRRHGLDERLPFLAGFLYAIAVLPIQNAHFFTVDAYATFFIILAVALALRFRLSQSPLFLAAAGLSFGFALACKISALYGSPLIVGIVLAGSKDYLKKLNMRTFAMLVVSGSAFVICAYVGLRIGDPRIFATARITDFSINPQFKQNIAQLKSFSEPTTGFPPAVQWLSKKPLLFPLQNIAFFGLGVVYFIFSMVGIIRIGLSKKAEYTIIAFWMTGLLLYQGSQFVTTMRYFYPLYPFLALAGAAGIVYVMSFVPLTYRVFVYGVLFAMVLAWPLSFMAIYARPHSRVTASEWILNNIPAGSHIATEYWDDWLPLQIPGKPVVEYQGISLHVFDADTPEKWVTLRDEFKKIDYYILTSNRAYDSIIPIPQHYPQMSPFYKDLFAGRTEFIKVAEFTSYPTLPLGYTNLQFNDQWAEEAFTVYDHPKVTIFKKVGTPSL